MRVIVAVVALALFIVQITAQERDPRVEELAREALPLIESKLEGECRAQVERITNSTVEENTGKYHIELVVRYECRTEGQQPKVGQEACVLDAVVAEGSETITLTSCEATQETGGGPGGDPEGGN